MMYNTTHPIPKKYFLLFFITLFFGFFFIFFNNQYYSNKYNINICGSAILSLLLIPPMTIKKKFFINSSLGFEQILIAILTGTILIFALPPFNIPFFIFISIPILYKISSRLDKRNAFIYAWIFGAFYQMPNMYWIYKPLQIAGGKFYLLTPIGLVAIGLFSGFFTALSVLISHKTTKKDGFLDVICFSFAWTIMEYWRDFVFNGFPWGIIGYSWTYSIKMIQITSIIGIYGLSFITILIATSTILILKKPRFAIIPLAIITSLFVYGHLRLKSVTKYNDNINLLLIGSDNKQQYIWDPEDIKNNFFTQLKNTKEAFLEIQDNAKNIVIWPENAIQHPLSIYDNENFKKIKNILPNKTDLFITGALRIDEGKMFNSIFVLNNQNNNISYYDKINLVVFGEYMPSFLPSAITPNTFNLTSGKEDNTVENSILPNFGAAICYESLMQFRLTNKAKQIKWIINLTNDAWFADTTAPNKHFLISIVRAVERGVPLIRVANQGTSAIIDPYGRVFRKTKNYSDYIVAKLPENISNFSIFSKIIDSNCMPKIFFIITAMFFLKYFLQIYLKI